MNRVGSAIAGGIVGTTVLSALLILLEVQTRSVLQIFAVIARFVGMPDELFLGFLIYAFAGVLVWPLLFVALQQYIPRGPDPAAQGAVFATALWVVFAVTGRGTLTGPILIIYAGYTLLAHWAYGFTLGAVYARFQGTVPPVVQAH
jgi:hypothetical protein